MTEFTNYLSFLCVNLSQQKAQLRPYFTPLIVDRLYFSVSKKEAAYAKNCATLTNRQT